MSVQIPSLQPHLFTGLDTSIQNNIHFLNDDEVIYPVGAVITVHNFQLKKQKFIRLSDKGRNLTQVTLSPDKKLIAVAEGSEKLPVVTLWCADSFRKKKTLNLPADKDISATKYAAVEFTHDSKYVITITGEPDWTLYCFKADKGRLESFGKANNLNNTGTVTQVGCNPTDHNQVAVIGDSVLRCLGNVDFTWKQFGYNRLELIKYTSCCWLNQDRLLVGTNTGKLLLLETGEVRAEFHVMDLPIINMKIREEGQSSQTSLKSASAQSLPLINDETENYEVRSIHLFGRGFVFGFMNGRIHLYEQETPHKYRRRSMLIIPDKNKDREYDDFSLPKKKTTVNTIKINSSQDMLLATCDEPQIYKGLLNTAEHVSTNIEEIQMDEYGYDLHLSAIGGMSVAQWKPLCITTGCEDRSLKLWNFETGELELSVSFEDDIYSVSIHPTGLFCVVGFSDKLRYMTITIDDLVTTKEFSIRTCKLCSMSRMGHLFAAANGLVINVYSCISFDLLISLKGHNGIIRCMSWSHDDRQVATCGKDGAVYIWDVFQGTRLNETIIKSNPFTCVCLNRTSTETYAIGIDGHIRALVNSNVHRDVVLVQQNAGLDAMVLSQLDSMLFVAGNEGTIYSVRIPLLEKAEYIEFNMHRRQITQMCLSYDDKYLISGGVDGTLCVWKLMDVDDRALQLDKEETICNEVLISRELLDDKMEQIKNLFCRLKELETEHSYQMRQNDAVHSLKIMDIHSEYCHAIEELKIKNEQMDTDHVQEINTINAQISKMKSDHELFVQNLEATYNQKLIVEYNKFMRYEEKMNKMIREMNVQYEDLQMQKIESEESITEKLTSIIKDKDVTIAELNDEIRKLIREHESIKQQIEDDCDREIYELKTIHEKDVKEEQDINVRLRGEVGILNKKLLATQKDSENFKHQVFVLEGEHVKFKQIISSLEKSIIDSQKEIAERDVTIEDKEKRIFQLKSKNQELEKFKFILDFKIKELKSQIEPKERTIQDQLIQINEMVRELENLQKVILNLDAQLAEGREKLSASVAEVRKEIEKNRIMKKALQAIRMDIHHASGFVQNIPMLQKTVRDMYHRYNADKDFEVSQAEDTEAKSEFLRQRDFLERTVSTLHTQATKNTSTLSYDKVRLMEENAAILQETNQLRKNLQAEINQTKKLNSIIGMSYIAPKAAQRKVNHAMVTKEEIHNKYKAEIRESKKEIEVLVGENERLTNIISEVQRQKEDIEQQAKEWQWTQELVEGEEEDEDEDDEDFEKY